MKTNDELRKEISELLERAKRDIEDCKPFGHSSYGMGVAIGERDAFTEVLNLIGDTPNTRTKGGDGSPVTV